MTHFLRHVTSGATPDGDVVRDERLGGLLRSYRRSA
jgi:hypothetical protein